MTKTSFLSRLFKFTWLQAGKPNHQWDECLNLLMDKANVLELSQFYITFGIDDDTKVNVWIENHPYASGTLYVRGMTQPSNEPQCKTKTKIRLEEFVNDISSSPTLQDIAKKLKR